MGTIVINQTDCKQNVVLQSSVDDGITGGYYDAAGVWHEIGAGTEIPEIKVVAGKGINTSTGEETENPARALSDIIPITNETVNKVQIYVPAGYKANPKPYNGSDFLANVYVAFVLPSIIGTSAQYSANAYANYSEAVIGEKNEGQNWAYYSNESFDGMRILFEKENGTDATSAADFDGYAFVSGVLYHLVGE